MTRLPLPDDFISDLLRLFSLMSFFAAGPVFLVIVSSVTLSLVGSASTTSLLTETSTESSNSPIISALRTISPTTLMTFDNFPSFGATTSNTTLSVSISAIISSCFTISPSFFNQFAIVPSATDSGKVGAFICIVLILF